MNEILEFTPKVKLDKKVSGQLFFIMQRNVQGLQYVPIYKSEEKLLNSST